MSNVIGIWKNPKFVHKLDKILETRPSNNNSLAMAWPMHIYTSMKYTIDHNKKVIVTNRMNALAVVEGMELYKWENIGYSVIVKA